MATPPNVYLFPSLSLAVTVRLSQVHHPPPANRAAAIALVWHERRSLERRHLQLRPTHVVAPSATANAMLIAPWPTPSTSRLLALPVPLLNELVAALVETSVRANDDTLPSKGTITRFHAKERPPLEIAAYVSRLTMYTPYSRDALLLSVLYLDIISRIPPTPTLSPHPTPLIPGLSRPPLPTPPPLKHDSPPPPLINSYTIHRLLAATLLCASRFTSDSNIHQTRAAKVGGVDRLELVRLEVEVLKALQWRLYYSLEDVEGVSQALLDLGEQRGLVEPLPMPSPCPAGAAAAEEPTASARTSIDSSDASSASVEDFAGCRSPHLVPSPLSPSPLSSGPSSPASYASSELDEYSDHAKEGEIGQTLASRASSETVRKMRALSFGATPAAEVVADVVVC